jgi:hypothetical protein
MLHGTCLVSIEVLGHFPFCNISQLKGGTCQFLRFVIVLDIKVQINVTYKTIYISVECLQLWQKLSMQGPEKILLFPPYRGGGL